MAQVSQFSPLKIGGEPCEIIDSESIFVYFGRVCGLVWFLFLFLSTHKSLKII